jgi:hypothetical protein
MKSILTANRLQGCAIGAMIFSGFGACWLTLALAVRQWLTALTLAGILLVAAGLLLLGLRLFREARRFPRVPDDPRIARIFHLVNAGQWVVIFLAARLLSHLHLDAWTVPMIAGVVGLHLFPLAHIFRHPLHYVTGSLMILWALGVSIFGPAEHIPSGTAMGAGIILWSSAAVTLAYALRIAGRAPAPLQDLREAA